MSDGQPLPLSFKFLVAAMLVLLVAGILGAIALFTQTPERSLLLQMETDDGTSIEVYSGDTYLGTTPCDVPFALLQSLSDVEWVSQIWPPPATHGMSTVSDGGWSASLLVASRGGGDELLHVRVIQGAETAVSAIPLRVQGEGEWAGAAVGTGSGDTFSLGGRQYRQRILFSKR